MAPTGEQAPGPAQYVEDPEGDPQPDRSQHQQEDDEGENRQGDEQEFHGG